MGSEEHTEEARGSKDTYTRFVDTIGRGYSGGVSYFMWVLWPEFSLSGSTVISSQIRPTKAERRSIDKLIDRKFIANNFESHLINNFIFISNLIFSSFYYLKMSSWSLGNFEGPNQSIMEIIFKSYTIYGNISTRFKCGQ